MRWKSSHVYDGGQLTLLFADVFVERRAMTICGVQEIFLDQVSDHLCVGLGGELMALFDQLALERNVVFDDSVVHDDDSSGAVAMRVGVFFRWTSMGGPASVADTVSAIE